MFQYNLQLKPNTTHKEEDMNLPNQLSLFRIVLVPIIVILLEIPGDLTRFLALIVFIIASFTDFLDGYIARKFNLITNLGKLIDPLADKILTLAVFVELTALGEIPAWIVILIISRELGISIFRAVAASAGVVISAGWTGKLKTVFQMLAILMLLSNNYIGNMMNLRLDMIFVYLGALLTIISALEYVYLNRALLFETSEMPVEYEVIPDEPEKRIEEAIKVIDETQDVSQSAVETTAQDVSQSAAERTAQDVSQSTVETAHNETPDGNSNADEYEIEDESAETRK